MRARGADSAPGGSVDGAAGGAATASREGSRRRRTGASMAVGRLAGSASAGATGLRRGRRGRPRPRRWRRWAARARCARRPSRCPAAARQQLRWLGAAPASTPQPALAAQAGAPRAPSPPAAAAEAGLPDRERAALAAAQRAAPVAAQPGQASLDGLPAPPWPWKASGRAAAGLPSRPRGWRCGAASRWARGASAAALTRSGEGQAALEQPASACAALAAR